MKRRRALLSEEELLVMKERDKVHKASKRASETCEQTGNEMTMYFEHASNFTLLD